MTSHHFADPASKAKAMGRGRIARGLGALGRFLIVAGVVVLLFVAYQLWGTGLREAANQRALRTQFEEQLATPPPAPEPPATTDAGASDGRRTQERAASGTAAVDEGDGRTATPAPSPGDPVAVLRIPKLELDKVVVEGTDVASLRKGPGHQPGTAELGGSGNSVIAGHRTTYGAPFYRLDELEPGDPIVVQGPAGELRYTVTGSQVVDPTDVWILDPTPDDRLTLFTCTPRFSAAQRLVVTAALDRQPVVEHAEPPIPAVPGPAPGNVQVRPEPLPEQVRSEPPLELAAATGSAPTAAAWAAGTALLAGIIWLLGRRYRRLVAYPFGTPVVAVALFITFEHVAALLPSAV